MSKQLPDVGDFLFVRKSGRHNPRVAFRMHWDADLTEMVTEFTNFLRACGYHVPDGAELEFTQEVKPNEEITG